MKKAILLTMFVLAFAGLMMAQNWSSPVDVLGAHNNYGRGCAGCHQPHSGAYGSGHTVKYGNDTGSYALWGQDASPLYGQTIAFGDGGKYVQLDRGFQRGGFLVRVQRFENAFRSYVGWIWRGAHGSRS